MRSRHGHELVKTVQSTPMARAGVFLSAERKVLHGLLGRVSARVSMTEEIDERKDKAIADIPERRRVKR